MEIEKSRMLAAAGAGAHEGMHVRRAVHRVTRRAVAVKIVRTVRAHAVLRDAAAAAARGDAPY